MDLNKGDTQEIIAACKGRKVPLEQAAYLLATTYHETNRTMKPVVEAYWLSEGWRSRNLRYYPFHGRGYVQVTWEYNYEKASKAIGVDFVNNPDLTLKPEYASKILVIGCTEGWFTGKKLSDYITDRSKDYYNARRVVNGLDKARDIANYAEQYEKDLKAAGYTITEAKSDAVVLPPSFEEDFKNFLRGYGFNVS